MSDYFRAIAIDYDGTLTADGPPDADLLAALAEVRATGRKLVLVTGRIVSELQRVFPGFAECFDAVVAENGAVLHRDGISRGLSSPVPLELDARLVERGISFRRGQVLLDCDAEHELLVLHELRRIGSDCQLVRNRGALMVLPAGVTKGTGLFEALGELGISHHNVIGIGDAENDLSLIEQCELGVAVGDAVESLKRHADVVLHEPEGLGVERLLRGALLRDELLVEPRRWQVELGRTREGASVCLPGSQVSLLLAGASGSGKSYTAGLLAERLVELGYSVCIFDPEGDHAPLGRLRGVISVGGRGGLPAPDELPRLLGDRLGSLVVDLSQTPDPEREPYLVQALASLQEQRRRTGVPHWIFVEEAHGPLREGARAWAHLDTSQKGLCLVTFRPEDLAPEARPGFDFLLVVGDGASLSPGSRASLEALAGSHPTEVRRLDGLAFGQGVLVRLGPRPEWQVFELGRRWVRHVRHWHKYTDATLPEPRRFYFRSGPTLTGAVACNLSEFHRELEACDDEVLRHHLGHRDFSRWIGEVLQDRRLAGTLREIEQRAASGLPPEAAREAVLGAIERRYLG